MSLPTARLERPGPARQSEFLAAVRRSRELHGDLVAPPDTPKKFALYLESQQRATQEGFFVIAADNDELAGVVNVSEIVRGSFQSAYLGYYGFAPHAGTGIMRTGLRLVIDRCFGILGLHRLEANVQPHNTRSLALVRSLGFRHEGFSPRYLRVGGVWRDHERWAILADEWPPA